MVDSAHNVKIAPSVLAADFSCLNQEIASVASADLLHLDIMDGHFVPNISFGPGVVTTIRELTDLPLDVHLMVSDPAAYIPVFARSGADYLSFHVEATAHPLRLIDEIRSFELHPAVVLCPATPLAMVEELIASVDMVLLMSVNPGFGGQRFIEASYDRIRRLRKLCLRAGVAPLIEVDGGVGPENAGKLTAAGANVLVAGTSVFGASDRAAAIRGLRDRAVSER